jgi:cytochrome c oxidase assembly factor CtaG
MGACPLLVIGSPLVMVRRLWPRLAPRSRVRGGVRWWLQVIAGFALLNGGLWIWHLPSVYELTIASPAAIHVTDLLFAVLGVAFWAQVIDQPPVKAPLTYVQRCIYLVAASMQLRFLALVIGFAETPYYAHYVSSNSGGLGALFDQRMGAGVILVPGVFSDLIALTACTLLWLADEDRRSPAEVPRDDPGRAALPPAAGWSVMQAFSRR